MKVLLFFLRLTSISAFHATGLYTRRALVLPSPSSALRSKPETKSPSDTYGKDSYWKGGSNLGSDKPASAFILASKNFIKQSKAIRDEALAKVGITGDNYIPPEECPPQCLGVTLSNEAVKKAELRREALEGRVDTNPVARKLYDVGCLILDELFDERPIARFWFLETIARIPYFTYVSMLHLYESLGWWRGVELRKVHNAQEYNELHHLLIMESLGGDAIWSDRFLGYHIAIGYYWILCVVFFFSPAVAYEFMELLESHAVDTYGTFLKQNKERLMALPAPKVAKKYYKSADLYLFDDFQVSKKAGARRPPCDNLYDVFTNIHDDEIEHVKTMIACQDYAITGKLIVSPHAAFQEKTATEAELELKRKNWKEWADSVNEMDSYESSSSVTELE